MSLERDMEWMLSIFCNRLRGVGLTQEAVEHVVQLSEEKYCPVEIAIGRTTQIKTQIEIENLENEGESHGNNSPC